MVFTFLDIMFVTVALMASTGLSAIASIIARNAPPGSRQKQRSVYLVRAALAVAFGTLIAIIARRVIHARAAGAISVLSFLQYFAAGGLCAFITHAACTPIDVVKTRIQTTQGKYAGLLDGIRKIIGEEGPAALLKGFGATAGGYFLHGAFKYSFYELFKVIFSESPERALNPPMAIAALAGFGAECIACLLLCPMEAVRIRSVADYSFPNGVIPGLVYIYRTEGMHGFYKGLPAMMLKQVPYTVGQFVSYEYFVVAVRSTVQTMFNNEEVITSPSALGFISAVAGLLAGVAAAIISHPGDTILSRVNQDQGDGAGPLSDIARVVHAAGVRGLFSGLSVRIIQVACMLGGQFLIYDTIKMYCGIKTAASLVSIALPGAAVSAALQGGEKVSVGLHQLSGLSEGELNFSAGAK